MKKLFFLVFIAISNFAICQTDIYDSIYAGGRWRTYLTHFPKGYNTSKNYPLVLAFHGGSPFGYQSIQYQSRLSQKADTSGFIIVYPEGVKVAGNRTWNAGGCCAPATKLNIDDVGFVNSLLNKLFSNKQIDSTRVYATGFSNGALLSYRLANQLTHRFAAIAAVAGDLMYYPWNPSRAIPIISFHSYLDQNIKYQGGVTIGTTGTYFPPQDSMFNIISANYSCTVKKEILFHDVNKYDHFKYSNCSGNAIIEQYVSYDGEHSWPGGLASTGTTVSKQFSATYLMWKFFQNYTINGEVQSHINEPESNNKPLGIFPNPANDIITVYLSDDKYTITFYNQLGEIEKEYFPVTGQKQINCSEYPKGLYFIQAKSDKNVMTGKLIKQ